MSSNSGIFSINTSKIESTGQDISKYGQDVINVLNSFGTVVESLTTAGMKGDMSKKLKSSYDEIKDDLLTYANHLKKLGDEIETSATNTKNAATRTAGNISVKKN